MASLVKENTLEFEPVFCIGCKMCLNVCPHGVFIFENRIARPVHPEACMECGACQRNCPSAAIRVNSGVGCASAMIIAVLSGKKEVTCGPDCCR